MVTKEFVDYLDEKIAFYTQAYEKSTKDNCTSTLFLEKMFLFVEIKTEYLFVHGEERKTSFH